MLVKYKILNSLPQFYFFHRFHFGQAVVKHANLCEKVL